MSNGYSNRSRKELTDEQLESFVHRFPIEAARPH
jgi:hypothetical protein